MFHVISQNEGVACQVLFESLKYATLGIEEGRFLESKITSSYSYSKSIFSMMRLLLYSLIFLLPISTSLTFWVSRKLILRYTTSRLESTTEIGYPFLRVAVIFNLPFILAILVFILFVLRTPYSNAIPKELIIESASGGGKAAESGGGGI